MIPHTQTHAAFFGPLRFVWSAPAGCLSVASYVSSRYGVPRSVTPRLTQPRNASTLVANATFIHRLNARAHSMPIAPPSNSVAPTTLRTRNGVRHVPRARLATTPLRTNVLGKVLIFVACRYASIVEEEAARYYERASTAKSTGTARIQVKRDGAAIIRATDGIVNRER